MAEIVTVSAEHYQGLSVFLARFQNDRWTPEEWLRRFQVWWDANPAFSEGTERGWLLYHKGVIGGFIGNIPTYFQLWGETIVAYNATTWRVVPEHRNESMRLFFQLLEASQKSVLFNTTPTETITRMLLSLKFQLIPTGDLCDRVLIINSDSLVRKFAAKYYVSNKFLIRLATHLAETAQVVRSYKLRCEKCLDVVEIIEPEASFDDLWRRTKRLYANTNVRTANVVNWYCFADHNVQRRIFGCYKNSNLMGYAIFKPVRGAYYRSLECLDFWYDVAEESTLGSLLFITREYARRHSYDYVRVPQFNNILGKHIKSLGLSMDRNIRPRRPYFRSGDSIPLFRGEGSYFVGYQGDVGFW